MKKLFTNFKNQVSNNKQLYFIIFFLLFLILIILLIFWVKKNSENRLIHKLEKIDNILNSATLSKENCEMLIDFDKEELISKLKWKKYIFNETLFNNFRNNCEKIFNIKYIEENLDNCKNIIWKGDTYFKERYIILDDLENKRNECISKYLLVKFWTWSFFDVENDFKSYINIDFSIDFYTDIWDEWSDEYMVNRIEAKKRLKNLLEIKPKVKINIENIILHPKKATLALQLDPLKEYTISLKSFETELWKTEEKQEITIHTPENKYYWFKKISKVSIFRDTDSPKFKLLEYNSGKKWSKIKICRIPNETYAKIEVFRKRWEKKDVKDFFLNWIDKLETYECFSKEIVLPPTILLYNSINNEQSKIDIKLKSQEFDFKNVLWNPSRSWLYYVIFENKEDREYNNNINYPEFFGIIDSHITMKISKNWEAFFFVNDFNWNALPDQTIKLYSNNFKSKKKDYNYSNKKYEINYYSPLEKSVFDEPIVLWKTWKDWILKVDLKDKVKNYFYKTLLNDWQFDYEWLYDSFFVSASSGKHLTYVNSTWNSWIAPWNFGYKISNYWYWNNSEKDQEKISLNMYWRIEPEYYSHTYTDRVLYLPWEIVNIKSVIRKSSNLSIPKNQEVVLKINDSKWKEILNQQLIINDFGSINDSINISKEAPLWNYHISLLMNWEQIWYSWFSIEVFKNPKFKNEVLLETEWLNEWLVKVDSDEIIKHNYWDEKIYNWKFKIKAKVLSKYYNWNIVKNVNFTYKVYKQYYYENSYWDDCYYWCYWEPRKELYTEWKWKIDNNWIWKFDINIKFTSSYSDYKYIVEVTVTDTTWDTISWTNSIIAKLPTDYKRYNKDLSIEFKPEKKFIKTWNNITIQWWLNVWKWTNDYNDRYVILIKKKEYSVVEINDIRWYKRSVNRVNEKIEKMLLVNNKNFNITRKGKLELKYKLKETWEYIFEYGKVPSIFSDIPFSKLELLDDTKKEYIDAIVDKKYFSILTYSNNIVNNPVENDNKIRVIPEKISYNLWEKARVLIRLPYENSKILWTIEKQWVVKSEYIDVKWNIFFKEFIVDDTFIPNAYIWVVLVDTRNNDITEYKIWYTEIVVDKTSKKSFITIKSDKEKYKPREKVTLDLKVKDNKWRGKKAELTVMVVDDSLISLMWNVDLNTLEKFYKKLPFQIQTSITSIAMLKNYYFSRPWIVWGSWFANFKWWDSAVSTRNIFKNTAYYNPSVITWLYWDARVTFELPDNLTNFRVMVISNSQENLFWYQEEFIKVSKPVLLEDKTPLILRDNDKSTIWANIFNNTEKEIWFILDLEVNELKTFKTKNITIKSWESKFVSWNIINDFNTDLLNYKISVLWDTSENSDILEWIIEVKKSPLLINNIYKSWIIWEKWLIDIELDIPENTDIKKSKVQVIFSNNRLNWIKNIVTSLAKYPYWCIEQTVSSTLPNVIIKKFSKLFAWVIEDNTKINDNIKYWVDRISSMQTNEWWFAYWWGESESNLYITPYVVRSLIDMKENDIKIPEWMIERSVDYLLKNINKEWISDIQKAEIFWALAKAWKKSQIKLNLENIKVHTLIAYTYWLILDDKIENKTNIDNNIDIIKGLINNTDSYNWYRNNLSDKAIFTSMLIDYATKDNILGNNLEYIDKLIVELYDRDWKNYYYSTQSKNNAFIAFSKYIEKYASNNHNKFWYSIWSIIWKKAIELWKKEPNIFTKEYSLEDIIMDKKINVRAANMMWWNIYYDIILKQHPKDKLQIKKYSHKMSVKRKIFEVLDEKNLNKCRQEELYRKNNNNYSSEYSTSNYCKKVLKQVSNNIYQKWKLYKTKIIVNLDSSWYNGNMTIEDYLPASFKVINSKFKTEDISIKQNTSSSNSWKWKHTEFRSNVVMANVSYISQNQAVFEYFFRPEFKWTYIHPPVTSYIMYNPKIRANSEYEVIEVK